MSKLDFNEVSKELNKILNKKPKDGQIRNLVFWYDGEGEFKDKLSELDLPNAKIIEFTGKNYFEIKYTLEKVDLTNNYLIYSPMYMPHARYNYLYDMYLYSQEFKADITTIYMREFGITDPQLVTVVKKYKDFLNNKDRRNRLKSYGITKWTEQKLHIGVLCAICKQPLFDFEKSLITIFADFFNNGTLINDVRKYCAIDTLNKYIETRFGIIEALNDLEKFATDLLLLHTALYLKGTLPATWKINLPDISNFTIKNNAYIFVDRFMKDKDHADDYIKISKHIAKKLNVDRYIKDWDVEAFEDVDTFENYDTLILSRLQDWLLLDVGEFERYLTIIKQRRKSYWNEKLTNEYLALHYATKFLAKVKEESHDFAQGTSEILYNKYVSNYFKFDQYYREFITAYDKTDNEKYLEIFNKIENTYTNWYLEELSTKWSAELKLISYDNLDVTKQWDFYNKFIHRSRDKIAVIISDALRFECGEELNKRLLNTFKAKTNLIPAISTIPSYTALGMASLLPHNKIEYNGSDIYVDGINAQSSENREQILNSYINAKVYVYKDFINPQNYSKIKSEIGGKKVIYIYHNTIDATGDNLSTESKVFGACEDCFVEIRSIVQRLQNLSISNVLITADHGFIYKRNDIKEMNKTPNEVKDAIISKRRFILSKNKIDTEMSRQISLNYLIPETDLKVIIPYGVNIYKKQGESCKYVHGGDSLQEIVIPIIQIDNKRSQREKYAAKNVTISCVSLSNKITSLITFIEFFQNEKVTDKLLAKNYIVYLEDDTGKPISNSVVINADSKSDDMKDRMYKEKFTLRNQKYDRNKQYYLIIEDYDNNYAERIKLPYTIDIIIDNDFDL